MVGIIWTIIAHSKWQKYTILLASPEPNRFALDQGAKNMTLKKHSKSDKMTNWKNTNPLDQQSEHKIASDKSGDHILSPIIDILNFNIKVS